LSKDIAFHVEVIILIRRLMGYRAARGSERGSVKFKTVDGDGHRALVVEPGGVGGDLVQQLIGLADDDPRPCPVTREFAALSWLRPGSEQPNLCTWLEELLVSSVMPALAQYCVPNILSRIRLGPVNTLSETLSILMEVKVSFFLWWRTKQRIQWLGSIPAKEELIWG
jgi:hypothetical protein